MSTVKSTININSEYMDELKFLVSKNIITSLTEGINQSLELFIKEKKKELYEKQLAAAANDKDFLERTLGCQSDFDKKENGAPGEW